MTTVAVDQCGCGNTGQYFDYAVGAEYGTAGMQSSISGTLTSECSSCGGGSSFYDGGFDAGYSDGVPAYDSTGASSIIEQGAGHFVQ